MGTTGERGRFRELTPLEREVLEAILDAGFDGAEVLRSSLDAVVARPSCSCGCPSIELAPRDGEPDPEPDVMTAAPVDIGILPGPGELPGGGMILWIGEGRIAELEVYSVDDAITEMPVLERIIIEAEDSLQ